MCIAFSLIHFQSFFSITVYSNIQRISTHESRSHKYFTTMLLYFVVYLVIFLSVVADGIESSSGADDCMTRCHDMCSGSSCPSNTLFYSTKCNHVCLQSECGDSVSSESSECLSCLESSNPTDCKEVTERNFNIERCKTCIFNIYFGMLKCVGITRAKQLTNCIGQNVHDHCKPCVCWAVCRFGLKNGCNCCRRGQCSQSRIDLYITVV